MRRTFLKSKLHDLRVTGTHLEYQGSLTLDPEMMRRAGILPWERIEVYNISNGNRFATYVIEGEEGSREAVVNGAAARLAKEGDRIILVTFCELEQDDWAGHEPRVLVLDDENRVVETKGRLSEPAGLAS